MTYNVGFGAYSPDYTFFMDTGVMRDGTKTTGKYGKAIVRDIVLAQRDYARVVLAVRVAERHMSAYDKGGVIRKKQAEMLKGVLQEEYDKGYYVIAGGDFNQD